MKCQGELSIIGAYGGYSKTPAKHAPVVGNSVLNLLINILGSGSLSVDRFMAGKGFEKSLTEFVWTGLLRARERETQFIWRQRDF